VTTRKSVAAILTAAALCLGLAACDNSPSKPNSQQQGQRQTEQAFSQQSTAVPYPVDALKDSLERRNLKEKLLRYNSPSKISYIYLLAQTGGIYSFFTVKGKVSSNSSQMTTTDLIRPCSNGGDSGSGNCAVTVPAPGDDGSYGPNEEGIFFFTTDGVMVTWNGPYLLTDAPLKVNAQNLVLQYQDGSKPTSTGTR
jgi:hypothetical protein